MHIIIYIFNLKFFNHIITYRIFNINTLTGVIFLPVCNYFFTFCFNVIRCIAEHLRKFVKRLYIIYKCLSCFVCCMSNDKLFNFARKIFYCICKFLKNPLICLCNLQRLFHCAFIACYCHNRITYYFFKTIFPRTHLVFIKRLNPVNHLIYIISFSKKIINHKISD